MSPDPKDIEKAVATILEATESGDAPVITQKDLVRRVLAFANTGRPVGLPGARVMTSGDRTFLTYTPEQDAQHAELRKDLTAIVKGELSAPAVARLRKQARYVTVRSYVLERGAPRPVERQFVNDLGPVLADVLLHVRGDEELRKDVRQCRLPGCGRFFLASDQVTDPSAPGRRRYKFCSHEHMNLAQTPGAKRTAEYRKRLKQAERQPARKH
jgi:hypothetical protein